MKRLKACHFCKVSDETRDVDFRGCNCGLLICNSCYRKHCIRRDLECPRCENPLINLSKLHTTNKSSNQDTWSTSSSEDDSTPVKMDIRNEDLANIRVIQRNLVYIIGLAPSIANDEELRRSDYFGQYGKITKVVVNRNKAYNPNGKNGPSYSAYITFATEKDAFNAIQAVDNFQLEGRTIRASYGTTKYCTYFLRNQGCPNSECLYLHSMGSQDDCFTKEEINRNRLLIQEQISIQDGKGRKIPVNKAKIKGSEPVFPVVSREILDRNPYLKGRSEVKNTKEKSSSTIQSASSSTTTTTTTSGATTLTTSKSQNTTKIKAKNMLDLFREELEQDIPQISRKEDLLEEYDDVNNHGGDEAGDNGDYDEDEDDDDEEEVEEDIQEEDDDDDDFVPREEAEDEVDNLVSSSEDAFFLNFKGMNINASVGSSSSSTAAPGSDESSMEDCGSKYNNSRTFPSSEFMSAANFQGLADENQTIKRAKSRFQFAQTDKESSNTIDVPDCLNDVIFKSAQGKAIDSENKEELEEYFGKGNDWQWLQKIMPSSGVDDDFLR